MPGLDSVSTELTVDLLERILDEMLPAKNKGCREEAYREMLRALQSFGIRSSDRLTAMIKKHRDEALRLERLLVENTVVKSGVFYGHCGLLKVILQKEVGTGKFSRFHFKRV